MSAPPASSPSRRRFSGRFRRSLPPSSSESSPKAVISLLDLADDLLQLICTHALRSHPDQTWTTPADLSSPTAQSWQRVSPRFRSALHACLARFSFFLLSSPHPPTSRAAGANVHILRATLPRCPNLRELQIFLRPRDYHTTDALHAFFAKTTAPLSAVHLCCAPPPHSSNSTDAETSNGDPASQRDPAVVVTDVIRAIASRGRALDALALDCCYALSHAAARLLADAVGGSLRRLALDVTSFQDWTVLARFTALTELTLQNSRISNPALRAVLARLPLLLTLSIHSVPSITGAALEPLPSVGVLQTLELSRCAGIEDADIAALAAIPSLSAIHLAHIDVSAQTLNALAVSMGPRLTALSVNALSTHYHTPDRGPSTSCLTLLRDTVKTHCPEISLDFGDASSRAASSHWSVRPYAEALRHTASPGSSSSSPSSSASSSSLHSAAFTSVAGSSGSSPPSFRIRPRRRSTAVGQGGFGNGTGSALPRPLSCFSL
jgi:hypothetical protein